MLPEAESGDRRMGEESVPPTAPMTIEASIGDISATESASIVQIEDAWLNRISRRRSIAAWRESGSVLMRPESALPRGVAMIGRRISASQATRKALSKIAAPASGAGSDAKGSERA